jgi:quinol monooxygenase YgiN
MLVFFGGMGLGSVGWGWLADRTGPATALAASGLWVLLGLLAAWRWRLPQLTPADLEPSRHWPEIETAVEIDPHDGPVLVTVEYRIDPARADEFRAAAQPLRGSRLRSGALRWDLFQDAAEPERFVEVFLVESWAEHLRQHERVTAADRVLQDKVTAFHKGPMPPVVRHLVASEGSPGLPTG